MTIRQYPIPFKTRTNPNSFPELQKPLEDLAAFAKDTQGDIVTINENITNITNGSNLRHVVTPDKTVVTAASYTLQQADNALLLDSNHGTVTITLHPANVTDPDEATTNQKIVIIHNDDGGPKILTLVADGSDKINGLGSITIDEFPQGASLEIWTDGASDWRVGGSFNPDNWPVDVETTTGPWVIPSENRLVITTGGDHNIGTDIYHVYSSYTGATETNLLLHSAGDVDGKVVTFHSVGASSNKFLVLDGNETATFDTLNGVVEDKKYLLSSGVDTTASIIAVSSNHWLSICGIGSSSAGWLS